jgi:uncharacterized RDD family membrane protein YckC
VAYVIDSLVFLVTLGIGWLVWSAILWRQGTTPGKRMFRLRCIDQRTGLEASWGTMAWRELAVKGVASALTGELILIVSTIMLGSSSRRTVWDFAAHTVVVQDR